MFFMGEEIVAQKSLKYNTTSTSKEDLHGERHGAGARMFRFYQDLIRLRLANPAARANHLDIVHVLGTTRVMAFTRRHANNELLIIASLNNQPFDNGYIIQASPEQLPDGLWQETFNSDAAIYGGNNVGNFGAAIAVTSGRIELRLPANGIVVLQRR
jgi:1,4-alpha-glucan branching enzyme